MRRCCLRTRRRLGGLLAFGGVMIVFICLPVEFFLIALGTGMAAIGFVLMDLG